MAARRLALCAEHLRRRLTQTGGSTVVWMRSITDYLGNQQKRLYNSLNMPRMHVDGPGFHQEGEPTSFQQTP